MIKTKIQHRLYLFTATIFMTLLAFWLAGNVVSAQVTNPQGGGVGLEGRIPADPPTQGATISVPTNGQSFSDVPIDVTGICPDGLEVRLYKNGVFSGSAMCIGGTFSITIDLFSGQNELVARVFDALDQPGPDSNTVTVTFEDPKDSSAVERITLTSNFSKRGAFPNKDLSWPVLIANGTPPYAIQIDWGDGTTELLSQSLPGEFSITHQYEKPGTYVVLIKATDADGNTAYLQLVAISNGQAENRADGTGSTGAGGGGGDGSVEGSDPGTISQRTITKVLLWPLYILLALIFISFWVGKRFEKKQLRKRLTSNQDLKL